MLIVPFIHKITTGDEMNVHNIRILTVGGKQLWEESNKSDIDTDILNPNDIYRKNTVKFDKNTYLCEVDTEKTNVNDLYKWSEIDINDNETFCWRDYVYFTGKNNKCWLNIPKNEKIGNVNINKLILQLIEKNKK